MDLLDKHGCEFEAFIEGKKAKGKIAVESGDVYLCQDVIEGASCSDTLGYKYSWQVGTGSKEDLKREQVKEFILTEKDYDYSKLPKSWCIKHDKSSLFKTAVVDYLNITFNKHYDGTSDYCYYGIDCAKPRISSFTFGTHYTLEQFIEVITTKKINNLIIKQNENNKNNAEGNIIKISRPISTISVGKRCTGNSICGERSRTTISSGCISHRKISFR